MPAREMLSIDQSQSLSFKPLQYNDPLVIGAGALVLGYVLGSGRWDWLGRGLTRVAGSLGTFAVSYLGESFQQRNSELFSNRRVS